MRVIVFVVLCNIKIFIFSLLKRNILKKPITLQELVDLLADINTNAELFNAMISFVGSIDEMDENTLVYFAESVRLLEVSLPAKKWYQKKSQTQRIISQVKTIITRKMLSLVHSLNILNKKEREQHPTTRKFIQSGYIYVT